jgi:ADP-ribose pyrophosphatase YjhB (NUDIX family)
MRYCLQCGSDKIETRIPEGDNRARLVCGQCSFIHYQNPKNVAGCILEWEGRVLLCKRGIEPRYGMWTVPAGFMENGETMAEAATRETLEEAQASPLDLQLYVLFSLPNISQVYMLYRGVLAHGRHAPGHETLETGLYREADIPWDDIAFPVMSESLKLFFRDQRNGTFPVRTGDIVRRDDKSLEVRHHQV